MNNTQQLINEVTDTNNQIIVSQKTFDKVSKYPSSNTRQLVKCLKVVNNYKLQTSYENVISKLTYIDFSIAVSKMTGSGKQKVANKLGKYISVDFDERTLTVDHKTYNFRQYTVVNCQSSENSNGAASASHLRGAVAQLVQSEKLMAVAVHML